MKKKKTGGSRHTEGVRCEGHERGPHGSRRRVGGVRVSLIIYDIFGNDRGGAQNLEDKDSCPRPPQNYTYF